MHHGVPPVSVIIQSVINMYKPDQETVVGHAGCDVSAAWVDAVRRHHQQQQARRFDNTATGHQALIRWLRQGGLPCRVVVEASGIYSLDLALALHEAEHIEVMVANPRAMKDYRRASMQRSKTDRVDAAVICDYAVRMPFLPWQAPPPAVLDLRQIARRIEALVVERTREKNRWRVACATATTCPVVLNDIEVNLRHLERRLAELEKQAMKVIGTSKPLKRAFAHLVSVRGIARRSAISLLAEVLLIPEGLSVRQWVAWAGLDVRQYTSGKSVERVRRISHVGNVHLRRALYMPALVAIRWEPSVGAFYEKLISKGKKPLVAIVAVMRKLLHAIYGMLKYDTDFEGEKFYKMGPVGA